MGPERGRLRDRTVAVRPRGRRGRLGAGAARPARRLRGGLRHRVPDGAFHLPRGCSQGRAEAGGVGRRRPRSAGRPPSPRDRRRAGARDRARGMPAARARRPARAIRGQRRPGPHAAPRARGRVGRPRWAEHRVRPGRRGEHGSVRSVRAHRRRVPHPRRLVPHRRRLRPLGRRQPGAPAAAGRLRARRLVGDGRAQVAQRSIRLRNRRGGRRGRAPRGDDLDRRLHPRLRRGGARRWPLGAGVLAPRPRRPPLRRAALAGSQRSGSPRRALLRPRRPDGRAARAGRPRRDRERRRAQPGAGPLRRRRRSDRTQ